MKPGKDDDQNVMTFNEKVHNQNQVHVQRIPINRSLNFSASQIAMATSSLSRRCLQNAVKNPHIRHQTRSLAFSTSSRLLKDGVHGSSNPEKDNPLDGPAYTAEGRRHKTDNEEQRVEAVRSTPEVCRTNNAIFEAFH